MLLTVNYDAYIIIIISCLIIAIFLLSFQVQIKNASIHYTYITYINKQFILITAALDSFQSPPEKMNKKKDLRKK